MDKTATTTKPAEETTTAKTETTDSKAAETTTKTEAAKPDPAKEAETKAAAKDAETKAAAEKEATEKAAASEGKEEVKTEATDKKEPVKYDLKTPKDSLLSKEDIDRVQKISQEKNLSPEQAQALLEEASQAVAAHDTREKALLVKEAESWKELAKNDKEYGGEEFAKNAELAKRVVDKFASKEFIEAISRTGLANHPELVRVFVRIGKAMSDDDLKVGTFSPSGGEKTKADKMFPKTAEAVS